MNKGHSTEEIPLSDHPTQPGKMEGAELGVFDEQATVTKILSRFLAKETCATAPEQPISPEIERKSPSIEKQVSRGIETLQQVDGLKPDVWEKLSLNERLEVLQEVENGMAEVQGRPAAKVITRKKGGFGAYSVKSNTIFINEKFLARNDIAEQVDVTIHEGRHAYQRYAIIHPGFHANESEVLEWKDNLKDGCKNFRTIQLHGFRAYRTQPVEYDAWSYAYTFRQILYG